MKLGDVVVRLLLDPAHETGWQAAFACSEAACRVNSCSQIRHLRTSLPTATNTFPIWSLRGQPQSPLGFATGMSLGMSLHPVALCPNGNRDTGFVLRLLHKAADARTRDTVLLRDLRQRHPRAAVKNDLLPVDIESRSSDLTTFHACPSHTAFDTLYNQ